jgi:hypothetical protein
MDNLNDLKKIWLTADTHHLPDSNKMMQLIKEYRNRKILKKIALIITAILLTTLMIVVVFTYHSTVLTTRIGEVCMIIAGSILVATNTNSLRRVYKLKNCTNKEFIEHLEQSQRGRINYYKKTQVIGFSFVSVGLLLYLFEGVYKNIILCITSYLFLVIWLLINWFVIRPKAYKRQTEKFNDILKKTETVSKQFLKKIS